ncbi:MAG: hypothetical protein AAGE01_11630 [Pseudomonadota bacterium]
MKKLKTILMLVGAMVIGGALWDILGPTDMRESPLVERVSQREPEQRRTISAEGLLRWGLDPTPVAVIHTPTDMLPNGLAASMIPVIVDWRNSSLTGDAPALRVRNVNIGGNPVTGDNVLATVQVPLRGIADVQWCLTLDRTGGRDRVMGHSQLRFVFDHEHRPFIPGIQDIAMGIDPHLDDLIVSWEAWRPPQTSWDAVAGLDPETYSLTVRAYAGAQRFLNDALRGNPWVCYPLDLPRPEDAYGTLLGISLAFGDSFMRRVIHEMVENGELVFTDGTDPLQLADAEIAQLQGVFSQTAIPDDPMKELLGQEDLSYQLMTRSCVTLSMMAIQWTLDRVHDRFELGPPVSIQIIPDGLPASLRSLSAEDRSGMLMKLPGTLWFVMQNQSVIPGNAWRILEDAGVLRQDEAGKTVSYYYRIDQVTPYGRLRDNVM